MVTMVDLAHKEEDQLKWLQEQEKRFESFQDSEYHRRGEVFEALLSSNFD